MQRKGEITTEDIYCHETMMTVPTKTKSKNKNKKNNNRKKREQKRQSQLKDNLTNWITRIYRLEANYQKLKPEIVHNLTPQIDSNRFYYHFHKIIESQVDIKQKTKDICDLYHKQQAINPALTAALYQKIEIILQASPQIEHIINYFTLIKEKNQSSISEEFLDKSTLKYIFDSEAYLPYKDQFIEVCQRYLETTQDLNDERQRVLFKKILEIIRIVDEYQDEQSEDYEDDDEYYEDYFMSQKQEMSPHDLIGDEQFEKNYPYAGKQNRINYQGMQRKKEEAGEEQGKKKRNKKKKIKKNKELIVSENYLEEVIKRISNLKIDEHKRAKGYVHSGNQQQWLTQLKTKFVDQNMTANP